jgi:hypothetical protein
MGWVADGGSVWVEQPIRLPSQSLLHQEAVGAERVIKLLIPVEK